MRILVAAEFSGIVRDAFIAKGHDAWSCDLLPTEIPGPHIICDLSKGFPTPYGLKGGWQDPAYWWDLMVCHPPCRFLAVSGARWMRGREKETEAALEFVRFLMNAPVDRIALENPISVISTKIRKPDQIIQPWMFGHPETKATCLWLKNLPKLVPTNIVEGRTARVHREPPSLDRWKNRSRTLQGIADAMADQWGAKP